MNLEKWHEASEYFAKAEDFTLLADYALLEEAQALSLSGKQKETIVILQRFTNLFPNSPLLRDALMLHANSLFNTGDFKNGYAIYQKFIEKYPSGSDSLE